MIARIFLLETKLSISSTLTTTPLFTSALTSSASPTTVVLDVTTTSSGLKWNSSGITVASGNGNSSILNPYAIFVDDEYYLYIAEKGNSRISKWPSNSNGSASSSVFRTGNSQLNQPPSLYVNSATGGIYVADESNNRVVFFANGSINGSNVTTSLSGPAYSVNAIYLNPNGTIFIGDSTRNRIYNWITNETVVGGYGTGQAANQFNAIKRFFIDTSYSFYVPDSNNNRVQKWFRGATSGITVAGGYGLGSNASQLSGPLGVVVDSQGGIIVCDSNNHRVQRWSNNSTTIGQTIAGYSNGTSGSGPYGLNSPKGIALDKNNNLYVVDANNLRIQKFNVL
ncbi:unnamed protein product [Adineta steineri]|uniref:NHL repeat containing protein-like protein n=1 Tax=Adineta steineri TaxID=433720 RepID=A0A814VPJ2_9BILA|nr:unnamed protein product [Adineta steineri]CAF1191120.1 unnamed protein product [Adineta steineri]